MDIYCAPRALAYVATGLYWELAWVIQACAGFEVANVHSAFKILRGSVLCACCALTSTTVLATPPGYEADTRAYNLAHGRVVFEEHCLRCHGKGRQGAPNPGKPADWEARIAQPLETLITHAIQGHGEMPARGETELNDQEIAAAVAYVVHRGRIVVGKRVTAMEPAASGEAEAERNTVDNAVMQMLLLLIGKDRWR